MAGRCRASTITGTTDAEGRIYYRPPNEATLIYTPSLRQIEVCADSPVVRQKVSDSFAEVALGHDVSQKPLTWKRYNLSRFRTSLRLQPPRIDGYEIRFARVLEAEVRLGTLAPQAAAQGHRRRRHRGGG